ncbi:TetR/AcrR family transcriptional regulator [Nocardia zapadnayensis]|uniref:TetR/AcrR family transcriptional regulator n=1 Tax=Nocardia rhamnosiphila TaxID=426716 RepID=UPI00224756BA|nr:TetR/AcrR family transcriptional regulator [Nocardia zapadnayensis]MCX0273479.1 TetR/AcrR family transcriptional regulator [Nocardia zapadnayensis]
MARPKSEDKRVAILDAATRTIAAHGLGVATAAIAKEAGVSNGSLFTYFDTKADLFNQLYLELKKEMAAAAMGGLPSGDDTRGQLQHMWNGWLGWAGAHPAKRRALAQLSVSEEIEPATHQAAGQGMAGVAEILEKSRSGGPMQDAPLAFVSALASALVDAAIDYIIRDPDNADTHARTSFDALWRMIA